MVDNDPDASKRPADRPPKQARPTRYRRIARPEPQLPDGVTVNSVQAQLTALESEEKGWLHTLLGLGISLVLFLNIGMGQTPLIRLGVITVVILIHEAGHFIGMKIFKYRNVRMFFIPLFGAVVTGENSNPDGWKRATVTLLGPLPGIICGILVGVLYYYSRVPIAAEFAVTFLALNAFNLLPIMPLDGGQFFHEVLFSRNRFFEAAFAVITGGLLAVFAYRAEEWILSCVGALIVLSSVSTLKIGKLVRQQRAALAEQGKDFEISDQLLKDIHGEFPSQKSPRLFAIHAKQIREKLRQSPPSGWATAGLLLAYVGSVLFMFLAVGAYGFISVREFNVKLASSKEAYDNREFSKAETECREALVHARAFGREDLRSAGAMLWIAFACFQQGNFEEAEKNDRRALEIREKILGPDDPRVANVLRHLAACCDRLKRTDEAEALRKRAAEIISKSKTSSSANEIH